MSKKFEKLKTLLKELFQLDHPDLDFGLYRIMHAKAAEVTQFLERDLLPQVKEEFGQYKTADKAEIEQQLAKAIEQAEALGADPDSLPKVKELRAKLTDDAVDLNALESEVYDHLYSFFRRYYSEGDFLSKRVYKPGVYAIPYEGEEVKLHWANADQYYIKTSEYLRDYAFRLRPDDEANPMRVHFRLVDATEGEHGNVKAAEGKDRIFILAVNDFIAEEDGEHGKELVIRFEYRPATLTDWPEQVRKFKKNPPTQKEMNVLAEARIFGEESGELAKWNDELSKPHEKADGERADYTRLHAHLSRYVARNTFDYFIHKDLGVFLRRELDFYVKNEVMHLDDIENESTPRVEQYLAKLKVLRRIAIKIIEFLAQLEDFQKKLWLKKKFVVETSYCIAIGTIPKAFHPEIASNARQIQEWQKYLGDLSAIEGEDDIAVTLSDVIVVPASAMLDSRYFSDSFVERLLESIEGLEDSTDSVLVHGENFQALNLMTTRYCDRIKTFYIDPPYNTGQDGFAYKDSFKSSTWSCMIGDRLRLARRLLTDNGVLFSSINEIERFILDWQLRHSFGSDNRVEELIWARDTVSNNAPTYSTNHEYIEVFANKRARVEADRRMFRETRPGYEEVVSLLGKFEGAYPSIDEIRGAISELYSVHKMEHITEETGRGLTKKEAAKSDPWKGLYPYKYAEYRDESGAYVEPHLAQERMARIWVFREVEPSMPSGKQADSIKDPKSDNYRFYRPQNPLTGELGKAPKRGWAFPERAIGNRPSFEGYCRDRRLVFKSKDSIPQLKYFLHEVESVVSTSVVRQYADGEPQLEKLFGQKGLIDNPKPPGLIERLVRQTVFDGEIAADFFAGSGTTAHAVFNQNRSDGCARKVILIEVADYFDSVLLPRVKKIAFSPDWTEGAASRLPRKIEIERGPRIVKVVRLESYEDALNNLQLRRSSAQQTLLDAAQNTEVSRLNEQYMLGYMLNVETEGSQSLLNVQGFIDPIAYKLKVKRPGSDESREVNVDLLETFNWLIGLTVQHIAAPQCFEAKVERDSENRLQLKGRIKQVDSSDHWFRTVTGTTPDGRKTLVIWRKRPGGETPEGVEQDNLVLDEWFTRQGYSSKDSEFDLIYVNGTNNLENLRAPDDTWKVRLIEDDFHRLMFSSEGI
jgi:adenine-specific DNA-methyltransferase